MTYVTHFQLADDLIDHLDEVISSVTDPFVASRYVGFVAVSGITVYELAIKKIFIDLSEKKHKVLGQFAGAFFERLNGRIRSQILKDDYLPRFGEKYVKRYKRLEAEAEKRFLRSDRVNVLSSYNNLILWRNEFAHEGRIPSTPSYQEVTQSYRWGKEVIHCLARTMNR